MFKKNPLTVDAALALFNTALEGLRAVKAAQDAEETRQLEAAAAANSAANVAMREAQRAATAIAKIEAIVGA